VGTALRCAISVSRKYRQQAHVDHHTQKNPRPSGTRIQTVATKLPPPFGLPSTTSLAEPTGWAIISDIDDTIKITQTTSPLGILHNTFCVEEPLPVPGMPQLYSNLAKNPQLQNPPFLYLSASPYNLYPFLREFREQHFPSGPLILRDASWQNLGGLIASLSQGTQEYKSDRIAKMHSWLPKKKVILIGDSTQSDPEAYGETARDFPGWVGGIFIRKVTGIAGMDEEAKNGDARFEKAFEGVEKSIWHVFTEPKEVEEGVARLVGGGGEGR
jgi:phosphatidate phosphatase APP1